MRSHKEKAVCVSANNGHVETEHFFMLQFSFFFCRFSFLLNVVTALCLWPG